MHFSLQNVLTLKLRQRALALPLGIIFLAIFSANVFAQTGVRPPTATLSAASRPFCAGTPPGIVTCTDSPIYVELSADPAYEIRYTFIARDFPVTCPGWRVRSSKRYLYSNPDQPNLRIPTIEIASAGKSTLRTIACDRDGNASPVAQYSYVFNITGVAFGPERNADLPYDFMPPGSTPDDGDLTAANYPGTDYLVPRINLNAARGTRQWIFQMANRCNATSAVRGDASTCYGYETANGGRGFLRGNRPPGFIYYTNPATFINPVDPLFTSYRNADACTHAQVAALLRYPQSRINNLTSNTSLTLVLPNPSITTGKTQDKYPSLPGLVQTSSAAKYGFEYGLHFDNVCILPEPLTTTELSRLEGISLDYEVHDGRTPSLVRPYFTTLVNLIRDKGKKAKLRSNPFTSVNVYDRAGLGGIENYAMSKFDLVGLKLTASDSASIRQQFDDMEARLRNGPEPFSFDKVYIIARPLEINTEEKARTVRDLMLRHNIPLLAYGGTPVTLGGSPNRLVNRIIKILTDPVTTTPPGTPSCTLTATPIAITPGNTSALSWTSTDATSGSIDHGAGAMTPIASGSKSVSPTTSTLYTATVTGGGGTATCEASVDVTTGTDSTPPAVSLTAPANNATVSSAVTLSANASDPSSPSGQTTSGMAGVQFKVDGANVGAEDTTAPYTTSWDTTTAQNGAHTIQATARDVAGNTKTTARRSVAVANITPTYIFSPDDRVKTTANLNIRTTPSATGTKVGTEPKGAQGTIVSGPAVTTNNTWWQIDWDNNISGWSVEKYLAKATTSPTPPEQPTKPLPLSKPITIEVPANSWKTIGVTLDRSSSEWMITEDTSTGVHRIHNTFELPPKWTTSDIHRLSFLAKPLTAGSARVSAKVLLLNADNTLDSRASMGCSLVGSAEVVAPKASSESSDLTSATNLRSDGWYRCTLEAKIDARGGSRMRIIIQLEIIGDSGARTSNYQGDGVSGIIVKNLSLEAHHPETVSYEGREQKLTNFAAVTLGFLASFSDWIASMFNAR